MPAPFSCMTHVQQIKSIINYSVTSPKMTCKTGGNVHPCIRLSTDVSWPSMWYHHFQYPKAARLLGRGQWKLACIFCGSGSKTSRKRNFEFWPMCCMEKMTPWAGWFCMYVAGLSIFSWYIIIIFYLPKKGGGLPEKPKLIIRWSPII